MVAAIVCFTVRMLGVRYGIDAPGPPAPPGMRREP
jgi:hypothetical protein